MYQCTSPHLMTDTAHEKEMPADDIRAEVVAGAEAGNDIEDQLRHRREDTAIIERQVLIIMVKNIEAAGIVADLDLLGIPNLSPGQPTSQLCKVPLLKVKKARLKFQRRAQYL